MTLYELHYADQIYMEGAVDMGENPLHRESLHSIGCINSAGYR